MFKRLLVFFSLLLSVSLVRGAEPDLLEPDHAFRFSARAIGSDAVEVRYQIAPGYYLYRDKFRFSTPTPEVTLGQPDLPPGVLKKDEFFGEVQTYRGELTVRIPVRAARAGNVTVVATSQGCADAGVCYVPHEQRAQVTLAAAGTTPNATSASAPGLSEDSAVAGLFRGNLALLVLSFFGFGLLLAFTPCVLPMIPILSGIIVGRGPGHTRGHAFALSVAYVLGMALTYAVAGVLAGLSGAMLSAALQNPWVLGTFAAVFVILAGAMFGFYELQLPVAAQSRLASATNRLPGGRFAGVFAMGVLSALIVGPCVAAPLAGALLYIGQSRDVVLGGTALFAMALGMGAPLLAVGASAGALLPKAGPWMETVKRFFGVVLLGTAIYFAGLLLPEVVTMLLWAALLILSGIFMRAIDPLPASARGFDRVGKGVGLIALVIGVSILLGALAGGRDLLQPLSAFRSGVGATTGANTEPVSFVRVGSAGDLERAVASAKGKPVLLDFYADWCVSCKEMERFTFTDPAVRERMSRIVKVQADVTANTPEHQRLLKQFRLFGPPGIVFFDREGREIEGLRVIGFQPAERFARVLDQVLAFERSAP